MPAFLNIYYRGSPIDAVELTAEEKHAKDTYYGIHVEDIYAMHEQRKAADPRQRRNRRFLDEMKHALQRFPILQETIQTLAPLLLRYLTNNLPTWLNALNDIDPDPDEPPDPTPTAA